MFEWPFASLFLLSCLLSCCLVASVCRRTEWPMRCACKTERMLSKRMANRMFVIFFGVFGRFRTELVSAIKKTCTTRKPIFLWRAQEPLLCINMNTRQGYKWLEVVSYFSFFLSQRLCWSHNSIRIWQASCSSFVCCWTYGKPIILFFCIWMLSHHWHTKMKNGLLKKTETILHIWSIVQTITRNTTMDVKRLMRTIWWMFSNKLKMHDIHIYVLQAIICKLVEIKSLFKQFGKWIYVSRLCITFYLLKIICFFLHCAAA